MVQKAMLLMLLVLIINALSIPSHKIMLYSVKHFFYKPWLVQEPRQITLYLSEKTFSECC